MKKDKREIIDNVLEINRYISNKSNKTYSGKIYTSGSGYHSVSVLGKNYKGQRDENIRLKNIVGMLNKDDVVVDLGCNAGGTLHHISNLIKKGYGFDYNRDCINAANLLCDINDKKNIRFYTMDLDNEPLSLIQRYIAEQDISWFFMLSISMWLKDWRAVARFCSENSKNLLFEANGKSQSQQINHLRKLYSSVNVIYTTSEDDPGQKNRIMVVCKNV